MNETLTTVLLIILCMLGLLAVLWFLRLLVSDDGKPSNSSRIYVMRVNPDNGKLQIQRYRGSLKLWK